MTAQGPGPGERFARMTEEAVQAVRDRARARSLYTDAALARAAGIQPSDLSPIFNKKRPPSMRVLMGLAKALDTTAERVLSGDYRGESEAPPSHSAGRSGMDGAAAGHVGRGAQRSRIVDSTMVYFPALGTANGGPGSGNAIEGDVQVGIPSFVLEQLHARGVQVEAIKVVEISGDCMTNDPNGDDLRDGDFGMFDPTMEPRDGDVVCVTVFAEGDSEGAHIVKRYRSLPEGQFELTPNVVIPGVPGRQVFKRADVQIEGVLVSIIHSVNRRRRPLQLVSYVGATTVRASR